MRTRARWTFSPERLREIREGRGLSRPGLARRMDVRAEAVKNWEIGANAIQMDKFLLLVTVLECEPGDLFEKREL